jgi:hypothetical protein
MTHRRILTQPRLITGFLLTAAIAAGGHVGHAQIVPGTGTLLNSDDFEDENWSYVHNLPKSSKEEDEQIRYPLGGSNNGRWQESPKRGAPDVVERFETPFGGLEGSTGCLMLRSRDTGIPGRPMGVQCQDDFLLKARPISLAYNPNFVVRVYLPEWSEWEQRTGVSFGIRAGMQGTQTTWEDTGFMRSLFGQTRKEVTSTEPYYPGFFIQFNSKDHPNFDEDHAVLLIRADEMGRDIPHLRINQTGWWTFGMSVTGDGRCHFYARPGVENLTAQDHLRSTLPYGINGQYFNTVFFNVCSADNGQSWSTPWLIDDPQVYYSGGQQQQFARQQQMQQRQYRR